MKKKRKKKLSIFMKNKKIIKIYINFLNLLFAEKYI